MDKEEILAALQKDERVQQYLAGFSRQSAERFLDQYAFRKSVVLGYRKRYEDSPDNDDNFLMEAEDYYWIIAQKKLFNLQCRWRAGQIMLPEIKACMDFYYWAENIRACPFLEDITPEEIRLMADYLMQSPYDQEEFDDEHDWQDYYGFKRYEDFYPEWYGYYDTYMGTGGLLLLPDIREPLEDKYLKAWREDTFRDSLHQEYVTDGRPEIRYYEWADVSRFMKATEGAALYSLMQNYYKKEAYDAFEEEINEAIRVLYNEPDPPFIEAGPFPDAIYQAVHVLKARKIGGLLYQVHEDHLSRKAMGIGYDRSSFKKSLANDYREQIIKGRQLLGEPGDLEF